MLTLETSLVMGYNFYGRQVKLATILLVVHSPGVDRESRDFQSAGFKATASTLTST
jgi:hypothetical protein